MPPTKPAQGGLGFVLGLFLYGYSVQYTVWVPGAQGTRKVRWAAKGRGKRGGVRAIYFNRLEQGFIILLAIYAKSEQENMPAKSIMELKNE